MDNSLILSHLPHSVAYHASVLEMRQRPAPPEPGEIADAVCRAEREHARAVWETIHTARRLADDTATVLGRNVSVASFWSDEYPPALRALEEPPWNLFYKGKLPREAPRTLAVVGSRRPDAYGVRLVSEFLPRLTTRGLQVVSGLAHGIDSLAHHYATESGMPNFAVLGSGVDVLYPADNNELAARVLDSGGGLLSELPPGTQPRAMHFPRRNRIISGLADVVWVVQGAGRSGSLHTARAAVAQGKTVAAVPSSVFSELSQIPNRLIYDGACTVLRADDLDHLLQTHARDAIPANLAPQRQQLPLEGL
ncbi:MAG: DNA-protecting protein DprA [Deltaproteobacteria bacterium]|nr:DNA-protecting protein DprA [Deltaproteobacteria bacterium]